MADLKDTFLEPTVGRAIRRNRLRAGLTQVQLARTISRSGKFMSEVESGKARITRRDLDRLANAMGVSADRVLDDDRSVELDELQLPRRIRDPKPAGMAILDFSQLVAHLDSAGWLRNARIWMISGTEFPEENDVALVEQIASLVAAKNVSLRYVFESNRLPGIKGEGSEPRQGTWDILPPELITALRWSSKMRANLDAASDRVIGYAADWALPELARSHVLLWVETEDVSWSDVMPLLYCRGVTRTFENPNESVVFWYHLPRDMGSKLLLELAQQLKRVTRRPGGG